MLIVLYIVCLIILIYFIVMSICYTFLLLASIPDIMHRFGEREIGNVTTLLKSHIMPPITTIISVYNEEANILGTIRSVLNNDYPNIDIIVVNDGSTDHTLQVLIDEFELYTVPTIVLQKIKTKGAILSYYVSKKQKNLVVLDTEHSDKSDSLNAGLNACQTPLFITLDGDTLLVESDALSYIVFAMLRQPHSVAIGGSVYILNGCKFKDGQIVEKRMSYNPICAVQINEYLRSFLFNRSGFNALGGALCYAGAFTLFETQAVIEVGGFDVGNVAQDFEIITHLQAYAHEQNYPIKVAYTPAAVAWTDAPTNVKSYWHQRANWQWGSLKSLMRHKRMLFNPKYGTVGLFTYPFYLFGEIWAPVIEFIAYITVLVSWLLGVLDVYGVILFILLAWGFVAFLTMATALISFVTYNEYKRIRDLLWILFLVFFEQFGFRQYAVICKVVTTIRYYLSRLRLK